MNGFGAPIRFGSVCSGIEAASVAWRPLGWRASFLSEIEAFPRAVLRHHYPTVPLHGDFTTIQAGDYEPIDLLVGGTPCQSFSVAGLRGGLADERGNLALEYLRLAQRLRPRWLAWENVPGVFSSLSHDAPDPCPPPPPLDMGCDGAEVETEDEYDSQELHALQCFLAGLSELGYGFAYRVLDAQFAGVPQRRRRVFVVGYLGDWRAAAAVLFERHSLSGHPAPSREAGAGSAVGALGGTSPGGGWRFGADEAAAGQLIANTGDVGACLTRHAGRYDLDTETFIATTLRAQDGAKGVDSDCTDTLVPIAFHGSQDPDVSGDVTHPLGRNYGQEACIAFSSKDHGSDAGEVAPTRRAMASRASHQNSGGQIAVAIPLQEVGQRTGTSTSDPRAGIGIGDAQDPMFTLQAGAQHGVACVTGDVAHTLKAEGFDASEDGTGRGQPMVNQGAAVRRLTPRECERLQGFPDDYTLIPWRGRPAAECPDGPRYKALGNSMAVPVMAWIGRRIAEVEAIVNQPQSRTGE